jgi:hypothetical protein
LKLFDAMNKGKPHPEQIKPGNFLLSVQVAAFGHPPGVGPEQFQLVAPWNRDPRQWLKATWVDRYLHGTFEITTVGSTGSEGVARVKTMADVLAEYRVHPEPKSLGPDEQPCGRATIGLLHCRPVTGIAIEYIGKESNRLEEVQGGLVHDLTEVQTVIPDPRHGAWPKVVLPVLQDCSMSYLRGRSHRSTSTVKRIRAGHTTPDPDLMGRLVRAAAEFARRRLKEWGAPVPRDDLAACYAYLARRKIWRKVSERVAHANQSSAVEPQL